MNNNLEKFQTKRKEIFKKIIKLAYENKLKEKIDELPFFFTSKADNKEQVEAIKNEVLIAMGLNPTAKYDTELAMEVDSALNLKEIKEPLVTVNKSLCKGCNDHVCNSACIVNQEEGLLIEDGRCISCGKCIPKCPIGAISDKIEFIPLIKYIQKNIPVYANVAPAIVGQFGQNITLGMLRSALKSIGFTDMVEVALFADIITLREANEYSKLIKTEKDFMITSCCCPIWVNLLTKFYPELNHKLTKTVSPMIASGRIIKTIFPDAITVFIGPCIAKKAEAKQPELRGAIDYVLTFDELNQIFEALDIDLTKMPEDNKEQSSYGGRIYGRTGGVSEAVKITLERINPAKKIEFKAKQVDGVKACKELLDALKEKKITANFIEGMGCIGGCVGGPKNNISIETGTRLINEYGHQAEIQNPVDTKNIAHILKHLNKIAGQKQEQQEIDHLTLEKILLR